MNELEMLLKIIEGIAPKHTVMRAYTLSAAHKVFASMDALPDYEDLADIAFEFMHWVIDVGSKPEWLPEEHEGVKENIHNKTKSVMAFYEAYESSQIQMP